MKTTKGSKKTRSTETTLSVIYAKDYAPGKEAIILQGVQELLVSSTALVNRKFVKEVEKSSGWLWDFTKGGTSEEEKKCDDSVGGRSADLTPHEMDGIIDSMTYVLEVMESYRVRAHDAALEFMEGQNDEGNVAQKLAEADRDGCMWDLKEVAKDMSGADLLLGPIMQTQAGDEYPIGSTPIFSGNTSLGPATDMFLGSLSCFLGVQSEEKTQLDNGRLLMDSKLKYLEDVQTVSSACKSQIKELDTILNMRVQELDSEVSNAGIAKAFEHLQACDTMITHNSVIVREVEGRVPPPNTGAARSYIEAARDKLSEYSDKAQKILHDEVRCMVTEYTCAPEKCYNIDISEKKGGLHFESIRQHFYSDAYNLDFKAYLAAESSNEMQMTLLNTLHSSMFLRNVGDKCQQPIRLHVGQELSASICNAILGSLLNSTKDHRITEWGACLFKRHAQALNAYVYEFCQSTEGTESLLSKAEVSAYDAPAMDANWERLFSALDLLKLEKLEDYHESMLHPLCTSKDAQRILRLRTEFDDDAIDAKVLRNSDTPEGRLQRLHSC